MTFYRPGHFTRACRFLAIHFWIVAVGPIRCATADWRETCETPEVSWKLIDRDCQTFRERQHVRQFRAAHSGQGCEYIHLLADYGTFVHYGMVAEPCHVIDPLLISLWVKSSRPGLQLLASVVLPRTINPRDGKPVRTVLRGASYSEVGQWQELTIQQPERLLRQQEASLRFQFGAGLDIREAYLDLIVVNAYGGRGETELWLDDLEVTGEVRVNSATTAKVETPGADTLPAIHYSGSELLAGDQPQFLRIIEHNGEPLAWLKSLGFNCVRLAGPPSDELLSEAKELGIWVIGAPPEAGNRQPVDHEILAAWDAGRELRAGQFDTVRDWARQSVDASRRIPLTGSPVEEPRRFADVLDFVIVDLPTIGSGWELADFGGMVRQFAITAALTSPYFVGVPTEPPPILRAQWQALAGAETREAWLEPEQLRLLATHAALSGARGIVFQSRTRLDSDTPATRLRARTLELINLDLQLLHPFISGGRAVGRLDVGDRRVVAYGIETDRAQLVVACRQAAEQQFAVSSFPEQPVTMVVPAISSSASAYQLTGAGMQQVAATRIAGGMEIRLEHMGMTTFVVLTQEDVVLARLAQLAQQGRPRRSELMLEIVSLSFDLLEEIRTLRPTTDNIHLRRVADAAGRMEQAGRLLAARDHRSVEIMANQALNALAAIRRDLWEESARAFATPVASPCCALFSSLPWHWELADRLRGRAWTGNALPGGDMEDLSRMLDSGWSRETSTSSNIATDVQLAFDRPRSGRASLKLQAAPLSSPLGAVHPDRPPIVIRSAPIPVRRGQLLQIRGWARVAANGTEPAAAIRIHDSVGGRAIGERLSPTESWQEWTLYRVAGGDGSLVIHFELEGFGEAWIDDVSVQLLDLEAIPSSQRPAE